MKKAMACGLYLAGFFILAGGSVAAVRIPVLHGMAGRAVSLLPVGVGASLLAATVLLARRNSSRSSASNSQDGWGALISRIIHGDPALAHLRRGLIRPVWKQAFPFMLIDSSLSIGSSFVFEWLANEASLGFASGSLRAMVLLSILRFFVPFLYMARAAAERITKFQEVNFVRASRGYILLATQGKVDINHLPPGLGEQLLYNTDDLGIINVEAPVYAVHYFVHFAVSAGLLAWESWPVALAVIPGALLLGRFLWPRYVRLQHLHAWITRLSGSAAARAETAHQRSVLMMTRGNGLRHYAVNLLGHSFDRLRRFEASEARMDTSIRGYSEMISDFLFSALPELGMFWILYLTGVTSVGKIVAITILTANMHHSVDMGLDLLRRCHIGIGNTGYLLKFLPPDPSPSPIAREIEDNSIQLQHLYYSVDKQSILNDISIDVAPGGMIEVRGPNGAGKSILLGLVAGLYRPTPGPEGMISSIKLGGLDPQEVNGNQKAGVFSGEGLFEDKSVAENLFPVKNRLPTTDEMRLLVNLANAPFIKSKPDQKVSFLSAGQKRRLRIAMALYRLLEGDGAKTALTARSVLFLDEPFEHLDKKSADRLEQTFRDLHFLGMTLFIINHHEDRLHSVPHDVFVLEEGRITSQYSVHVPPGEIPPENRLLQSAG